MENDSRLGRQSLHSADDLEKVVEEIAAAEGRNIDDYIMFGGDVPSGSLARVEPQPLEQDEADMLDPGLWQDPKPTTQRPQ